MFLGFDLSGQRFASRVDELSELMRVSEVTKVPGTRNFVVGVSNLRGQLVTVIDLALFFGSPSKPPESQRWILVAPDGYGLLGFMVDECFAMQQFPDEAYTAEIQKVPEVFAPFVQGGFQVANIVWPLLDLKALADAPELEQLIDPDVSSDILVELE